MYKSDDVYKEKNKVNSIRSPSNYSKGSFAENEKQLKPNLIKTKLKLQETMKLWSQSNGDKTH